jgi:hypothetical protein
VPAGRRARRLRLRLLLRHREYNSLSRLREST